jgi:hypothetical protein
MNNIFSPDSGLMTSSGISYYMNPEVRNISPLDLASEKLTGLKLDDDQTRYITTSKGEKKLDCLGKWPGELSEREKKRGGKMHGEMTEEDWAEEQFLVYFQDSGKLLDLKNALKRDLESGRPYPCKEIMLSQYSVIIKRLLEDGLLEKTTKRNIFEDFREDSSGEMV